MAQSRFVADGFTLLEVVVALVILGATLVVGLEAVGLGANVRAAAADYTDLRLLAEEKLAELAVRSAAELKLQDARTEGRFAPPFQDVTWVVRARETEPGTALYRVEVDVRRADAVLRTATYLNRFGEQWTRQRPARR